MSNESLAEFVKSLRGDRGWSQAQLAIRARITRSHISLIELGRARHPRTDVLLRLGRAFGIPAEELYAAAGYDVASTATAGHVETVEEIVERLRQAQPVSIPVYKQFINRSGAVHDEPVEYIYLARSRERTKKNFEAFIVQSTYLSPQIEGGDIVVIDRDKAPDPGDAVICLLGGEIVAGHYQVIESKTYLCNNEKRMALTDVTNCCVVIEVIKRLTK